jgi:hypothetical protein
MERIGHIRAHEAFAGLVAAATAAMPLRSRFPGRSSARTGGLRKIGRRIVKPMNVAQVVSLSVAVMIGMVSADNMSSTLAVYAA